MKHLKLHRPQHISSLAEPEEHLVAFLHTFGGKPDSVIQIRKLVRPFFTVIPLFQFFKDFYALLKTHFLRLVYLILQHVPSAVLGRKLNKLLVILKSLHKLSQLDGKLTQRIDNQPSPRMPLVCKQKNIPAVLISSVNLI